MLCHTKHRHLLRRPLGRMQGKPCRRERGHSSIQYLIDLLRYLALHQEVVNIETVEGASGERRRRAEVKGAPGPRSEHRLVEQLLVRHLHQGQRPCPSHRDHRELRIHQLPRMDRPIVQRGDSQIGRRQRIQRKQLGQPRRNGVLIESVLHIDGPKEKLGLRIAEDLRKASAREEAHTRWAAEALVRPPAVDYNSEAASLLANHKYSHPLAASPAKPQDSTINSFSHKLLILAAPSPKGGAPMQSGPPMHSHALIELVALLQPTAVNALYLRRQVARQVRAQLGLDPAALRPRKL